MGISFRLGFDAAIAVAERCAAFVPRETVPVATGVDAVSAGAGRHCCRPVAPAPAN
jgi:hypothetical protein